MALEENGAIRVDDRLRTTNRRIYAAGDVVGGRQYTHLADAPRAHRDPERALPGRARSSSLTVPECTFTDPEVARVGHDRMSAAAAGLETRAFVEPWDSVDRARSGRRKRGLHEGPGRGRKRPDRGRHDRRPPRRRGDLDRHARHAVGDRSRRPREPHPPVPDPRAGARSDRRSVPADAARSQSAPRPQAG